MFPKISKRALLQVVGSDPKDACICLNEVLESKSVALRHYWWMVRLLYLGTWRGKSSMNAVNVYMFWIFITEISLITAIRIIGLIAVGSEVLSPFWGIAWMFIKLIEFVVAGFPFLTAVCTDFVFIWKKTFLYICSEFEEVLKAMRWPVVGTSLKVHPVTNTTELKIRLGKLFKRLLHLQLPYPFFVCVCFCCFVCLFVYLMVVFLCAGAPILMYIHMATFSVLCMYISYVWSV